ncbi:hypothetical protein [Phytomonospora endophytica]|uniref:Uncharacterized protein n=1 Tax=Phytomonospora endophytica TaxID=714109 RepID=A0A841FVB5_9ACTN|nr:hypothetical protein [Phytomonospora endophytica]MBB6039946.1 hypothetical protein [Phytomonospora endophytica]GIG70983.1 hypothetical protein Pen01_72780 [Phytomonospora endophytica]
MSAWDDYLAAARDLARLRSEDTTRGSQRETWVGARRAELAEIGTNLTRQRTSLENVATVARMPLKFEPQPAPHLAGADVAEVLRGAREDAAAADALVTETDYLAHRPPLFPRWRVDERNAVIYGVYALFGLLVQVGIIVGASAAEDTLSGRGWVAFWCFLIPLVAFGLGWLTIGVAGRPRLGDGKPVRNPRLGLIVCLSTWLIVCLIGGQVVF